MYCEKLLPTDVAGAMSDGEGQKLRFATPPPPNYVAYFSYANSLQDKA